MSCEENIILNLSRKSETTPHMIQSFKQNLKKYTIPFLINARIREFLLHFQYKKIESKYRNFASVGKLNHNFSINNKLSEINLKGRKPKILWVGLNYTQDNSGLLQGLHSFAEVTYFTQSDGKYGMKVPLDRSHLVYYKEREQNGQRLIEIVKEAQTQGKFDLILGQMWASNMDPEMLKKLRESGYAIINIAMDDMLPSHWMIDSRGNFGGAIGLAESVDLTLNTTPSVVNRYIHHGGRCQYWPLASSEEIFKPRVEKKYDVVFVGSNYGYRKTIINHLIKCGINIQCFGPGFPSGMISGEKSAEIFGSAKIMLGIGYIGHSRKLTTLKLRDFDALFTGALYITTNNEALNQLFSDKNVMDFYSDLDELVSKIKYYLSNDDAREKVINNALTLARNEYSWGLHLSNTLKNLGLEQ